MLHEDRRSIAWTSASDTRSYQFDQQCRTHLKALGLGKRFNLLWNMFLQVKVVFLKEAKRQLVETEHKYSRWDRALFALKLKINDQKSKNRQIFLPG